jgi:hypothetical protein
MVRVRRMPAGPAQVLQHHDVVGHVRDADLRDPGDLEQVGQLEGHEQAHPPPRAACRRLAEEALVLATPRRVAVVAAYAAWTLPLLDLTEGRPLAALERLLAINTPRRPTAQTTIAQLATGTLVESAAHAGRLEGIEPFVARFERWAQWDRRAWTQVIAHYCRALITQGEEAERHYQAALAVEGLGELPCAELRQLEQNDGHDGG